MNKKLIIERITKFEGWDTVNAKIISGPYWLKMNGRICPVNDSCSDVTGNKCASDAMEVVTCSTFFAELDHMATAGYITIDDIRYKEGFQFVAPRDCGNSLVAKV
jgi:hypothetical protein